jgi:hypothetical protein
MNHVFVVFQFEKYFNLIFQYFLSITFNFKKEIRGGKSFQKLGYIDYNLSDYLNKSETINRVLKEYDSKNRLDNSFLKVKIKVNEQELLLHQQSSPIKELIIDNNKTNSSSSSSSLLTIINNHKKDEDCLDSNLLLSITNEHNQFISHTRNSSKSSALSFNEKGHQRFVNAFFFGFRFLVFFFEFLF